MFRFLRTEAQIYELRQVEESVLTHLHRQSVNKAEVVDERAREAEEKDVAVLVDYDLPT
jgi:hypothetical protein